LTPENERIDQFFVPLHNQLKKNMQFGSCWIMGRHWVWSYKFLAVFGLKDDGFRAKEGGPRCLGIESGQNPNNFVRFGQGKFKSSSSLSATAM
jgi:hypothetical protein